MTWTGASVSRCSLQPLWSLRSDTAMWLRLVMEESCSAWFTRWSASLSSCSCSVPAWTDWWCPRIGFLGCWTANLDTCISRLIFACCIWLSSVSFVLQFCLFASTVTEISLLHNCSAHSLRAPAADSQHYILLHGTAMGPAGRVLLLLHLVDHHRTGRLYSRWWSQPAVQATVQDLYDHLPAHWTCGNDAAVDHFLWDSAAELWSFVPGGLDGEGGGGGQWEDPMLATWFTATVVFDAIGTE